MELFDVYSLFNVTPVRAKGCKVWDDKGQEYLDLYGGHAVISVGHCHPHYNEVLTDQLGKITLGNSFFGSGYSKFVSESYLIHCYTIKNRIRQPNAAAPVTIPAMR